MRLYRTAEGRWVGLKAHMKKGGRPVDVPTSKAALIDFLNDLTPTSSPDRQSPAYIQGRHDAELGRTVNPYGSPDLRAEWDRGHDDTVAVGLGKLPRFGRIAMSRSAPRQARSRARPGKEKKKCTTARCRANRNRPQGMLG